MTTLILNKSEIEAVLQPAALLTNLRSAFAAYSGGAAVRSVRLPLPLPTPPSPAGASAMIIAPGWLPDIPAYTVKVHAKFPGLSPAIQGVIVLHDIKTGAPLAILESTYLTALRTALAGALGADLLAVPGAAHVAIIGAGQQGRSQLEALRLVRPVRSVKVFDVSAKAAQDFLDAPCCDGLDAVVANSPVEAIEGAQIAVTATWSTEPLLHARDIHPGLHITTLGPDQPGKVELSADLLEAALVVVDDRRLAVEMGAVAGAGLDENVIDAELGEIIAGTRPGRRSAEDVTIFGSVGLAFQDLVASWTAYRLALEAGLGRSFDLTS
jgi:ornithine cyclodeaminase